MSDDKPAEKTGDKATEKPAEQRRGKPATAPMTHRETGRKWEAQTRGEVQEMVPHGWGLDDPAQDLSKLPSGARSPGRGTPTGDREH